MTGDDDAMTETMQRRAGLSAWRQIADRLEAEIALSRPGPGEQLPTEAVLADRFRVNRHTVRRALRALAERGLVRASQGRGTFVEGTPLAYPIGQRTRFSEIVAGGGREPGGVLLAAASVALDEALAAALVRPDGSPALRLSVLRSADGAPISFGTSWLPLPRFAGVEAAMRAGHTLSAALAEAGAGDYRRAWTRITARHASAEETVHLELAPGRIVLVTESLNVDGEGAPIQRATAVFAADRVEIAVES